MLGRISFCVSSVVVVLALVGCGQKATFGTVPITGKVVYEDGSLIPAARITVSFISQTPAQGKEHPRPGNTTVNVADGTFKNVTTLNPSDGAVVGKHKVLVIAYDEKNPDLPGPAVDAKYADPATTPLTAEVTSGADIVLKVEKPRK
jgi:hypothetical protein